MPQEEMMLAFIAQLHKEMTRHSQELPEDLCDRELMILEAAYAEMNELGRSVFSRALAQHAEEVGAIIASFAARAAT